jgi:hypothetical protein
MPGIFGCHPFSFKNMAEVATAMCAHDFGPFHTESVVGVTKDSAGNFIIEGRPSAAAVELVGGVVQRCVAPAANKSACRFKVIIFACKSPFRTLVDDDLLFFGCERIPVLIFIFHTKGFYALPTTGLQKS